MKDQLSSNQHITEFLTYFINYDKPPYFAVMLNGNWGSGKTWFIKNFIERFEGSEEFLYVSLNGVRSYQEIENSFFEQLHPWLAKKGVKVAAKVLSGVLKATVSLDLLGDKKDDVSLQGSASSLPPLKEILQKEIDHVLIFGDLERCAIPVKEILGYLNYFVEGKGLKVIIISNEKEISSKILDLQDKDLKLDEYRIIKEKLIGHTFTLEPDYKQAFKTFLDEVIEEKTKEFLKGRSELVKSVYLSAGYHNLRHLRQSIWDFARFYKFLPKILLEKAELIDHVLQKFFALSFEIKSGNLRPEDISSQIMHQNSNAEKKNVFSKYTIFSSNFFQPFDISFWTIFFIKGAVQVEDLEKSIKKSSYFQEEMRPNWLKLWYYLELEDEDFQRIRDTELNKLKNKEIDDPIIILHLTGMFLRFINNNALDMQEKDIGDIAIAQFQFLYDNKNLEYNPSRDLLKYNYGYGFMESQNEIFRGVVDNYEGFNKKIYLDKLPSAKDELMNLIKVSARKFAQRFTYSSGMGSFYDKPVLKHLDPKEFVEAVFQVQNREMDYLINLFETRYAVVNSIPELLSEIEWLEKVENIMEARIVQLNEEGRNIKGLRISQLQIQFKNVIATLRSFINQTNEE